MLPRRLIALLKRVSRSFYLSVRVLPAPVQPQVALGYLLARAADTIADTRLIAPAARIELLEGLRAATTTGSTLRDGFLERLASESALVGGRTEPRPAGEQAERALLAEVGECLVLLDELPLVDRQLIARVLDQLGHGMVQDLKRFPSSAGEGAVPPTEVVALRTAHELDEYTYYAAGCVGEFWTDLMAAHLPSMRPLAAPGMRDRGVDLGKALQLVNVIRDVVADLQNGRCYWPAELLSAHGLSPIRLAELAQPQGARATASLASLSEARAVRAVTEELHQQALVRCESAWPYVQAIPPRELRLRLACVWPLFLALDTLALLRRVGSPLFCPGTPVKVRRGEVYGMTLRSTLAALRDGSTPAIRSAQRAQQMPRPASRSARLDGMFAQRLLAAR